MSVSELFTGEPTLVPAGLRGYRTWSFVSLSGLLRSTGLSHSWCEAPYDGTTEQAQCLALAAHAPGPRHPAPQADCTCGLYAWYDPTDRRIPLGGCTGPVFGVVQATGRVVLGTHGMRAERLEVVAITAEDEHTRHLLRWYGYPVHDSAEAMLAAYPPEDVSALVQHECDGGCLERASGPGRLTGAAAQWQALMQQLPRQQALDITRRVVTEAVNQAVASGANCLVTIATALRAEADRITAEAKKDDDERRRRESDPKAHALEQRKRRNTGPSAPSLFRAAMMRRGQ